MARNSTLEKLLRDFRAECKLSLNAAHNNQTREGHIILLQRQQEELWEDFDWPLLKAERFIDVAAGQRYYDMPADMRIDRIQKVEGRFDDVWCTLQPGIYAENYSAYDSDKDERQWPVQRWQITEGEMLEVWPIPSANFDATTLEGRIKITGIRNLNPLVADSDRADLDDRLIVLNAAAEYLGGTGSKDAQLKLDKATRLYGKLRGHQQVRKVFPMFGIGQNRRVKRVPIAVHNSTS